MPQLTLLYFSMPGRAGAIRDALRIGGIAFEDVHVDREGLLRLKSEGQLPYGSLPVLDVGGDVPRRFAQSNAILRYAGKLSGLYPEDVLEALRVDELVDFAEDMSHALAPSMAERDMEKKLAMRAVIAEQKIPAWCRALDARLAANDDPHHFVGTSLTIADLKVLHGLDALTSGFLDGIPTNVLDGYPRLLAWRAAVRAERDARIAAGGA